MNVIQNSNLSLNARNSPFEQVANSFVPNDEYDELRKNCHSVLLGPRGSGKTTLFKMLTRRAISRWNSQISDRRSLEPTSFLAIYIPADIHWNKQIAAIWRGEKIDEISGLPLARAALNTGIMRAAVEAIFDEIGENEAVANKTSLAIASVLQLKIRHAGFSALKIAFADIRVAISTICNSGYFNDPLANPIRNLPPFCSSDYLPALGLLKETASSVVSQIDRQWAICFDELEICPPWLQIMIVGEMRSTDQDFLFKLSASPIPENFSDTFADHLNDFKVIKMWPYGGKKEDRFIESLAKSWLARRLPDGQSDPRILITASEKLSPGYSEGQDGFEIIQKIAKIDPAISKFIASKGIRQEDLAHASQEQKDTVLRKLRPVCLFREAYRNYGSRKMAHIVHEKVLKRAPATLYAGFDQMLLISDFNPRRLVLILDRLLEESVTDGVVPSHIPVDIQMKVIGGIGHEFSAYVSSFPESRCIISGRRVSLMDILKEISEFFRSQLLGIEVIIDPVGLFSVPDGLSLTNPSLCEMLRKAAWLGAIVNVDADTKANPLDGKVEKRTFRISYTLAPVLGLMLRASKARGIGHCLKKKYSSLLEKPVTESEPDHQTEFDGRWLQ